MAWNVLIAGGGFGGLYAARSLERALPPQSARVTIVNDVNFMLYTPLLPGAAAGTLEPRHVVVPLRPHLKTTELRLATVTGLDAAEKRLKITTLEDEERELAYDQLIVALGSTSRTLPVPGLAEYAFGFKTLPDAILLRNRLLQNLEIAESLDDPAAREAYLTWVFVGAGYAGLEGLAELQDFAVDAIELYPRCRVQGMHWVLVEAMERVMPEIPPKLAAFAERELRARGVEIRTGCRLDEVGERTARLSNGETLPTRTVVWTTGVRPVPVVARLGLPLGEQGRIQVDEQMRVPGVDGVWAIGDAAAVPDPARPGRACPPTCQHALRQGRVVGRNVAAALGSGRLRPFTYKTLGVFVDMGRHQAVATTMGLRWRGFFAWFLARTYHMLLMPGLGRKLRLVTDWTVGLLFRRDSVELGQLGHPSPLGDGEDAG